MPDDVLRITTAVDLTGLQSGFSGAESIVATSAQKMTAEMQQFTAQGAASWKEFTALNMSSAMKFAGGHGEAMKLLSSQWASMKGQAQTSSAQIKSSIESQQPVIVRYTSALKDTAAEAEASSKKQAQAMYSVEEIRRSQEHELTVYGAALRKIGATEAQVAEAQITYSKMSVTAKQQEWAAIESLTVAHRTQAAAAEQTASAEVVSALKGAAGQQDAASKTRTSASEARFALRGVGQEIGVAMPRFVAAYLSKLGPVQGIMAAAFAPIAVIGLIQVLAQLPKILQDGISALRGWNEEAKKAFDESVDKAKAFRMAMLDNVTEIRRAELTAGMTGAEKVKREQDSLRQETELTEKMLALAEKRKKDAEEGLKGLTTWYSYVPLSPEMFARIGGGKEIDQFKKQIEAAKAEIDSLDAKIMELRKRRAILPIEEKTERASDAREISSALVETENKAAAARLETAKRIIESEYRLNQIGLEEKVAAERRAAEEELTINLEKLAGKRAQVLREQKETGKPAAAALTEIDAEEIAAREENKRRILEIETSADEERRRRRESETSALIEAEKRSGIAIVAAQEDAAKRSYETHRISATEEMDLLLEAEASKFGIERSALVREIELTAQQGEKKRDVLIRLMGQLQAMTIEHENEMARIRAEGRSKDVEDQKQKADEILTAAQNESNRELQFVMRTTDEKLRGRRIGIRQWAAEEHAAIDQWYTAQRNAIEQILSLYRFLGLEQTKEYRALITKLEELDRERAQRHGQVEEQMATRTQQALNRMTAAWNQGFAGWAVGTNSLKEAWANTWNAMVANAATNLMKMGEQMIMNLVLQKTIGKQSIAVEAYQTAAHAFKSVMKALPFPANVIVAPAAAAAAFAAVMAFGSFQKGGVVAEDMIAQVHKKEMVLPTDLSAGIQALIKGGGTPSPSPVSGARINYAPTIYGDDRMVRRILEKHRRDLALMIRKQQRRNMLPSYP